MDWKCNQMALKGLIENQFVGIFIYLNGPKPQLLERHLDKLDLRKGKNIQREVRDVLEKCFAKS